MLELRQAEAAIEAGRLDEAFDLLIQNNVRSHRRGQTLASDLLKCLKRRVAEHIANDRYEAALRDCERATMLGGNQADLAAMREGIVAEMSVQRDERLHCDKIGAAARKQIANGDLTLGLDLCQQLPDATLERDELSSEITLKQQAADKAVHRAEAALKNDAWEDAVEALHEAQRLAAHRPNVCDAIQKTVAQIVQQARHDLETGQLGHAETRLTMTARLSPNCVELRQLQEVVSQSHRAAERIRHGKYAAAREPLHIVRQLLPNADWVATTLELAEKAQHACDALQDSPLSLLTHGRVRSVPPRRPPSSSVASGKRVSSTPLLLAQVDSGGRCLVLRKDVVRIGPRSRRGPLDIAVQARDTMPNLEIARIEDDYFLRTAEPVQVNGQTTTSRLLVDGDQIVAGSRCSVKFMLPCEASRSALLQITGVRLEPSDVRQVILMDDAFLIGPDAQSHLRVRQLSRRFVMLCRNDQFSVQPMSSSPARQDEPQTLVLGEPLALDGVTLLVHQLDG